MARTPYVVAAVALFAQQWSPPKPSVKGNLTRAESDSLKAKMAALAEILHDAAGPDVTGSITILADEPVRDERRLPVSALVSAGLRAAGGQPARSIGFVVNSLESLVVRTPYLRDEAGPIYIAPLSAGERGGYPLYESGSGRSAVLVLASGRRPVFVAVSRGRVLQARIADARRLLEELNKLDAATAGEALAGTRQRLRALEAELAAMPAEERSAPAHIGNTTRASGLADAASAGARALVAPNPRLLDPSLPRAAIRIISFGQADEYGAARELEAIRGKLDLERVAKILD